MRSRVALASLARAGRAAVPDWAASARHVPARRLACRETKGRPREESDAAHSAPRRTARRLRARQNHTCIDLRSLCRARRAASAHVPRCRRPCSIGPWPGLTHRTSHRAGGPGRRDAHSAHSARPALRVGACGGPSWCRRTRACSSAFATAFPSSRPLQRNPSRPTATARSGKTTVCATSTLTRHGPWRGARLSLARGRGGARARRRARSTQQLSRPVCGTNLPRSG